MRHLKAEALDRSQSVTGSQRTAPAPVEHIAQSILVMRDQRVLLDTELAVLYGVTTKRFNEQVRRNRERFPEDFMFQLTPEELTSLRSQFATLKGGRGRHRKYLPYAFTEHGAIMAATILNSPRAAEEVELSRSQTVILNHGRGQNTKNLPCALTEHGAIQAANILNSPRAIEMGV
jgi:hypothetical protein